MSGHSLVWLLHTQGHYDRKKTKKTYCGHAAEQMIIALPGLTTVPPNKTSAVRIDLFTETTLEHNDPFLAHHIP